MKKFRVLLVAAVLGTLPVTAWAFGGHMGGGAGGHVGMGPGGRFAFRQDNRFAVARLLETATFSPIIAF